MGNALFEPILQCVSRYTATRLVIIYVYSILTGQNKRDQTKEAAAAPANEARVELGAGERLDGGLDIDDRRRVGRDNGHLLLLHGRRNVSTAVPSAWRRSVVGWCRHGRQTVRRVSMGLALLLRCRSRSILRRTWRGLTIAMHVSVQLVLDLHLCDKPTEDHIIITSTSNSSGYKRCHDD